MAEFKKSDKGYWKCENILLEEPWMWALQASIALKCAEWWSECGFESN